MAVKLPGGRTTAALAVGVLAGSMFAAGGMAAASSAFDSDVIYACVAKKSGDVRLVAESAPCRPHERKTSWNKTGPQGSVGSVNAKVEVQNFNFPGKGNKSVFCGTGKTATGGGYFVDEPAANGREIMASAPVVKDGKPIGWLVVGRSVVGMVYVICV
ncbi:hypothetical protein ACQEVF_45650 [Nonomuraea polychroma]|uniref:hypothetical protein n=1 Tax=Nonomuraea polychroma TaxID=46176 RepID=UPI003D91B157